MWHSIFFGAAGEKNLGENPKIQEELRTKKFCAKRSLRDLFKNIIVLGGPSTPKGRGSKIKNAKSPIVAYPKCKKSYCGILENPKMQKVYCGNLSFGGSDVPTR